MNSECSAISYYAEAQEHSDYAAGQWSEKKDLPSVAQPVIRFKGIFRTGLGMFG